MNLVNNDTTSGAATRAKSNADNSGVDRSSSLAKSISDFRLSTDFTAGFETEGRLLTIPVSRPSKSHFFRAWEVEEDWWAMMMLTLDTPVHGFKAYLLLPDMVSTAREIAPSLITRKLIVPIVYLDGGFSVWPIKLPDETGNLDSWNRSAYEIAREAKEHWKRLGTNREAGQYTAYPAQAYEDRLPDWKGQAPVEIFETAFRPCMIETPDHPVLKHLRGVS